MTGEHFLSLHSLFEAQYQDLAEAVDLIAERIRALGERVPAAFKTFKELQVIKDGDDKADWKKMLKDLHASQIQIIDLLNSASQAAQKASDEATADIMAERLRVHEKNKWVLQAILV